MHSKKRFHALYKRQQQVRKYYTNAIYTLLFKEQTSQDPQGNTANDRRCFKEWPHVLGERQFLKQRAQIRDHIFKERF